MRWSLLAALILAGCAHDEPASAWPLRLTFAAGAPVLQCRAPGEPILIAAMCDTNALQRVADGTLTLTCVGGCAVLLQVATSAAAMSESLSYEGILACDAKGRPRVSYAVVNGHRVRLDAAWTALGRQDPRFRLESR